jgi:hypothetical protein
MNYSAFLSVGHLFANGIKFGQKSVMRARSRSTKKRVRLARALEIQIYCLHARDEQSCLGGNCKLVGKLPPRWLRLHGAETWWACVVRRETGGELCGNKAMERWIGSGGLFFLLKMKVLFLDIAARYLRETNMTLQCALGYNKKNLLFAVENKMALGWCFLLFWKLKTQPGVLACYAIFSFQMFTNWRLAKMFQFFVFMFFK